jgi:hypothetical protein
LLVLNSDELQAVGGMTRVLRIIIVALMAGPAIFLTFVAFIQPPPEAADVSLSMAPLAAGMAVAVTVLAAVMPQVIGAQQRKAMADGRPLGKDQSPPAHDVGALLGSFQTRRIISAALLEGGAFFNIVAYMQERQWFSAAIAIAMILGVGSLFPIRSRVELWLERELRAVRDLRELNR